MRLHNLKLQGFRRFETEENLNVSSKLTAVVGPNEAGKTTLLKAIGYFSDDRVIAEQDQTSLSAIEVKLTLSFFLDKDDLEAANLYKPSWLHLIKEEDGTLRYDIQPRPERDLTQRRSAAKILRRIMSTKTLMAELGEDDGFDLADLTAALNLLELNDALDHTQVEKLSVLKAALADASSDKFPHRLKEASSAIADLVKFENGHNPFQSAINVLAQRRPTILNFTSKYRDIRLPYDVTQYDHEDVNLRQNPSRPLAEIFRLSQLDLEELKYAILSGNDAIKVGLLSAANEKLSELSQLAWNQSDAALYLSLDGSNLTVLVRNVKDFDIRDQFASFESRSDGYKQFVALQIFTFIKKTGGAILLIDEIEQHLHYDAQADLIQILQDEPTIGSVIYTTHSAGALPEDLGVGVRMVRWDAEKKKRSRIINKFWREDEAAGFKPLLFGMGATTLAFFPTRRALIGEGPTELLLLPRLLREALNRSSLDFQIVHGLSNISPKGLPMLDSTGSGVCYITDSDKTGRDLGSALERAGVPPRRIFSIADVGADLVTVEDLLDASAWVEAVNRYIDMYGKTRGVSVGLTQAPPHGRIKALPTTIQKEKVAFAYNVLELIRDNPTRQILNAAHRLGLRRVGERLRIALNLADTPASPG